MSMNPKIPQLNFLYGKDKEEGEKFPGLKLPSPFQQVSALQHCETLERLYGDQNCI